MLKYKEVAVTFGEVPSEVTLCINITGCPVHCPDCHSKWLWEDIGEELKPVVLSDLIAKNNGITCVAFMGGDNSPEDIYALAKWVKNNTELKVCWYSGLPLRHDIPLEYFDYIKTGSYKKELGGLDSITTNQRFYAVLPKYSFNSNKIMYMYLDDITFKFWKKEIDDTRNYQNDEE
jgi:anaerobic ribonucleoside-triphosphate reductase activating protein